MTIFPLYRACKSPLYLVKLNDNISVKLDNNNIRYYGRFSINFIIAKDGEIYCYC